MPSGSTISARLTCESPGGSESVTVAPLGTARCWLSSTADTDGVNGTFSQPVGVKEALSPLSVTVAGAHEVGIVMKLLFSVSPRLVSGRPPVLSAAMVDVSPPSGRRLTDAWFLIRPRIEMPSRAGSPGLGARL